MLSVAELSMTAGNINQFILKMSSYATSLSRTRGLIAEFINPKYKDASKTTFKSSTRLECMMQDYPKALGSSAAIGFTVVNQVGQAAKPGQDLPMLSASAEPCWAALLAWAHSYSPSRHSH